MYMGLRGKEGAYFPKCKKTSKILAFFGALENAAAFALSHLYLFSALEAYEHSTPTITKSVFYV